MHPKKLALPVAAALLLLAAAAGAATPAATPLGWYGGCDDAEAQNPGAPGGCRYDIRESDLPGAFGLASCADGVDNDSDERTDGWDPDCAHGDPVCGNELAYNAGQIGDCAPGAEPAHCEDGLDNDYDGDYDCSDADCGDAPACQGCAAVVEVCDNGQDDDCDGLVDGDDQDCGCTTDWWNWWQPRCGCPATERDADGDCAIDESWWGSACADGNDNDGDTYADCADADCAGEAACAGACNSDAPENCTDGQDDDCDGLTDCADGDCAYYCATYGNPGNPGDPENGNAGNGRGMYVDQEPGTEDYGSCGNGICEVGEEGKCLDCVVCNDGTCDPDFESYFTCPGDCPNTPSCGDGKCELLGGETTTNCSEDCGSRCGDGRCDAFTTPLGGTFEDSESCPEDCYGSDCGNGNCEYLRGETTETCSLDCKPFCGNLHCEEGENKTNCEQDCGSGTSCGDGLCDPSRNEDAQTCREDCGYYCGDGYCHPQINEDEVSCPPDCYVPQMRDPEGNPV